MEVSVSVNPRKQPKQARSKSTVEAIVEATAQVLITDGFDKASTNRIAERAGVSIGSLYQYFPNKEALVLAVSRRHTGEMLAVLEPDGSTLTGPLPEVVRSVIGAIIRAHAHDPELHRTLVVEVLRIGLPHAIEQSRRARALVRAFLEARDDEIIVTNLDAAAGVLVATVIGAVHAAVLEDVELLQSPAFEDELVALIVRYLTGGA